ncbi:MAG: DNA-binding domain-containing protein [Pirellulales bacterium]
MSDSSSNDERREDERREDGERASNLRPLDQVQRWMQAVITHPAGVAAGIDSDSARAEIPLDSAHVEQVIGRSRALGSLERLAVYANAYYARLMECLREVFPVVCRTMGEDNFDRFALGYLQKYPSQSYTLNELGARFAQFLEETRPAEDEAAATASDASTGLTADWPRFVVELARLEWTIGDVYDGPGVEKVVTMQAEDIAALSPERWMSARLRMAPCVRLLDFQFPVNDFFARMRELLRERADAEDADTEDGDAQAAGEELPIPSPEPTYLALSRRNYVVRRYPLSKTQFDLLGQLAAGNTVAESLTAATAECQLSDDELAAALHAWFAEWTADQFFLGVALD